jgi:hypothetical protein
MHRPREVHFRHCTPRSSIAKSKISGAFVRRAPLRRPDIFRPLLEANTKALRLLNFDQRTISDLEPRVNHRDSTESHCNTSCPARLPMCLTRATPASRRPLNGIFRDTPEVRFAKEMGFFNRMARRQPLPPNTMEADEQRRMDWLMVRYPYTRLPGASDD